MKEGHAKDSREQKHVTCEPSIMSQGVKNMTKGIVWIVLGLAMLMGCRSYTDFARSSSSDIPFHKRRPPSMEKAIIISSKGPQLEPNQYEVLGKVKSQIENVSRFSKHCKDAIKMLRYEAENVGADALIDVSCSAEKYSAEAFGTAIIFKDREQALRALKDMKAILE
jgi:hypothetical protein